jgi:hypothetical protein
MPPLAVRLSFGAGGAVYAVKEAAYTMFVLLFYTQVLGLNGSLTGSSSPSACSGMPSRTPSSAPCRTGCRVATGDAIPSWW